MSKRAVEHEESDDEVKVAPEVQFFETFLYTHGDKAYVASFFRVLLERARIPLVGNRKVALTWAFFTIFFLDLELDCMIAPRAFVRSDLPKPKSKRSRIDPQANETRLLLMSMASLTQITRDQDLEQKMPLILGFLQQYYKEYAGITADEFKILFRRFEIMEKGKEHISNWWNNTRKEYTSHVSRFFQV